MKLQTLFAALVIAALTLAPARAHADCTEDGSGCPGLAAVFAGIVVGGVFEGSMVVGGIVTMAGGAIDVAHHRSTRSWRVANYVFASLNLAAGLAWGIVAFDKIDTQLAIGIAVPHLAVGGADLTVALLSSKHSRDLVALSVAPMAGRDVSGHSIAGASLKMTF
jgi:heme A synthase